MATFGSFETEREVYSDLIYAVYNARKTDDPNGEYAVKVFRLPDRGLESEIAPGARRDELERDRLSSILVQQQAAATSAFVAPILETGNDSRGLWYATRFYPRSVNKLMTGKVALPRASLEYIVRSIAQGALDLQRACGRAHGDIRPSNVQVGKSEKLTQAEVVLCDPLPGGADKAQTYELNDLHAVGAILLQLVLQRVLSDDDVTVMLPIAPSVAWTRAFGADASDWLALCNRLLDPRLSFNQFSLEHLVARLEELRPKRKTTPTWAIAAGCAALVLLPLSIWLFRPARAPFTAPKAPERTAELIAISSATNEPSQLLPGPAVAMPSTSQPPVSADAKLQTVAPVEIAKDGVLELRSDSLGASVYDANGRELGHIAPDAGLKLTLPTGSQALTAKVSGLDDTTANVNVEPGVVTQYTFRFNYAAVDWTSQNGPVTVSAGSQSQLTPASFIQKPGVPVDYVLAAPGYYTTTNQVQLKSGERTNFIAKLIARTVSVALLSDPPGAQFFTDAGQPLIRNSANQALYDLPCVPAKLIARYGGLGVVTNQIDLRTVRSGSKIPFKFDYGILVLSNVPSDFVVYEGDQKIGAANDQMVYQKSGPHQYALRGQGSSLLLQTNITAGLNYLVVAKAEKSWKNSLGMWFAWVPNVPGGGSWPGQHEPGAWVGICEVTQGQYKKMDGSNPSAYQDGGENYPVENLTWDQAAAFCRWLSSADTAQRMGWQYALPSDEQFTSFAADADHMGRISSEGRVSSSFDDTLPLQRMTRVPTAPSGNNVRTHPEPVASKKANQYGLYDVVGNVWEWLGRSGGKENVCAGGSYLNFTQKSLGTRARESSSSKSPTIGFRIVLVPAQ